MYLPNILHATTTLMTQDFQQKESYCSRNGHNCRYNEDWNPALHTK